MGKRDCFGFRRKINMLKIGQALEPRFSFILYYEVRFDAMCYFFNVYQDKICKSIFLFQFSANDNYSSRGVDGRSNCWKRFTTVWCCRYCRKAIW